MEDLEFKLMLVVLATILSFVFVCGVYGIAHLFLKLLG